MAQPSISVAVATRNRPGSLERTLRSLRAQDQQPHEVIVSDDSDDSLTEQTRAVAEAFGCRHRRGPRRGLYANRNAAALACSGTHVRTMDDDHEFPVGHWTRCEEAVAWDPGSVWIIGEIVPSQGLLDTDQCPGELHPRGFGVRPADPDDTWAIADGATIYPADIFRSGITYCEAFRFGLAFQEFGSRLHSLGYRIRHLRGTYIIHHHEQTSLGLRPEEDLAAKAFATFSHSFRHQPTLRNKLLTSAELAREVLRNGRSGLRAVRHGYGVYADAATDAASGPRRRPADTAPRP